MIFTEGITHNAFPVLTATRRRSLFFNWVPAIDRNNLPSQRMSIFPEHVLERFPEPALQDMHDKVLAEKPARVAAETFAHRAVFAKLKEQHDPRLGGLN